MTEKSERACGVCGSIPYGGSVQGGGPLEWVHKPYCSKDCARVDYVVGKLRDREFIPASENSVICPNCKGMKAFYTRDNITQCPVCRGCGEIPTGKARAPI
jgi:hypothetical protein